MISRPPARPPAGRPSHILTTLLLSVTLTIATTAALAGQEAELTVAGTVIGPDSGPQADLRVVLHRVDATGGATVAETTSGADGRFVLNAPASVDTAAVYFIAARYEGELYIGQPFRAGPDAAVPHVLQVGVLGTSASALLAEAEGAPAPIGGRPATGTSWLLLLVPLLGVTAAVVYFLVPRRRIAPDRALFIRIAEIDERLDAAPEGQRVTLRQERARLIDQLRAG